MSSFDRLRKHIGYLGKYPGIIPRVVENYWRLMLRGEPRLKGLEFALTFACQCSCEHCSAALLRRKDRPELTLPQIKRVLGEAHRLGALNVNLTGGEFMLRRDARQIVEAASPRDTVVSVATNGLTITPQAARDMAQWGVRIVTISLDSADPQIHDAGRNHQGCHAAALRAADLLKQQGVEVFFCTILTRRNAADGDIFRMIEIANQRDCMLTINMPCPVGRWSAADIGLDEGGRRLHRELLSVPHVRWEGYSNYASVGCPMGIEKLYISPYGDVMPCNFLHIGFGDLRKQTLGEIWSLMLTRSPFNRIVDGCPVSSDQQFIERFVEPLWDSDQLPLDWRQHPAFRH
ncbi:MAG: radical SAM protein [Candidatus Alcyoniella australis]|nr:radical SAM protein [Candidatus Alcyoniella australis]